MVGTLRLTNLNDCLVYVVRYVYFAATTCDDRNENHRMFVIENTNGDPFSGSFNWKGQITDVTNKWAIDGTVLQQPGGRLYFIWSGWEGDVDVRQILYIAEMSNPWTISSPRVEIARPVFNWETNHQPFINEGPQVTIRNGVISLVYSASGSWTNDYCLGLITTSVNSDLLKAGSWQKRANPIFRATGSVFGPGHQSFTKSRDDREDWIIYHSARFSGSGWIREIRAQRFTWNADSTPNLGSPADPNTPLVLPSGDPLRVRYEAEDARMVNGPFAHPHPSASNSLKVGYLDYPESMVEFTIQCPTAGTYVIVIRNANGSAGQAGATHWLTINNGNRIEIGVVFSGWNLWGVGMVRANLNAGPNTLTFKKGMNFAEIDMLDVFPDVWKKTICHSDETSTGHMHIESCPQRVLVLFNSLTRMSTSFVQQFLSLHLQLPLHDGDGRASQKHSLMFLVYFAFHVTTSSAFLVTNKNRFV